VPDGQHPIEGEGGESAAVGAEGHQHRTLYVERANVFAGLRLNQVYFILPLGGQTFAVAAEIVAETLIEVELDAGQLERLGALSRLDVPPVDLEVLRLRGVGGEDSEHVRGEGGHPFAVGAEAHAQEEVRGEGSDFPAGLCVEDPDPGAQGY